LRRERGAKFCGLRGNSRIVERVMVVKKLKKRHEIVTTRDHAVHHRSIHGRADGPGVFKRRERGARESLGEVWGGGGSKNPTRDGPLKKKPVKKGERKFPQKGLLDDGCRGVKPGRTMVPKRKTKEKL